TTRKPELRHRQTGPLQSGSYCPRARDGLPRSVASERAPGISRASSGTLAIKKRAKVVRPISRQNYRRERNRSPACLIHLGTGNSTERIVLLDQGPIGSAPDTCEN